MFCNVSFLSLCFIDVMRVCAIACIYASVFGGCGTVKCGLLGHFSSTLTCGGFKLGLILLTSLFLLDWTWNDINRWIKVSGDTSDNTVCKLLFACFVCLNDENKTGRWRLCHVWRTFYSHYEVSNIRGAPRLLFWVCLFLKRKNDVSDLDSRR